MKNKRFDHGFRLGVLITAKVFAERTYFFKRQQKVVTLPLQKIKTGGVLLQRNTPPNPCVCKKTDHRIIILCASGGLPIRKQFTLSISEIQFLNISTVDCTIFQIVPECVLFFCALPFPCGCALFSAHLPPQFPLHQ